MPGAFVAESLGRFLELSEPCASCASALKLHLTASYAELMGFKLIVRIFNKKILAAAYWTLHPLSPLIIFPPEAEKFR